LANVGNHNDDYRFADLLPKPPLKPFLFP